MKKFLALLLVMVMCVGAGIGGTLAYLTDRDSEVNVFTVGNVDIKLTEEFDQGSAVLLPGVTINKKVNIKNIGENDAWVFYTYAVPEAIDEYVEETFANQIDWTINGPEAKEINNINYNVYVAAYKTVLGKGATTSDGLTSVKLSEKIDAVKGEWVVVENGNITATGWDAEEKPVVYVTAYAVQSDANIASVEDAIAAYKGQWGELDVIEKPYAMITVFDENDVLTVKDENDEEKTVLDENLTIDTTGSKMGLDMGVLSLDTAYQFEPLMSAAEGAESEFADWHADFVVYANKEVPANAIGLAGYYDAWCSLNNDKWVMLASPAPVPAGDENAIRLVGSMGGITVSYEELCEYGNDGIGFLCGAVALEGKKIGNEEVAALEPGTTLTVELRLYEATGESMDTETGKYITVDTRTYTFEWKGPVVSSDAELATAIAGGETTLVLSSGNYIIPDSAQGKTLTIVGNGDTVIATQDDGSYEGCDYSLDGATVTFENVVINTDSTTYTGYARCNGTYNNCTINGTYTLYGDSVFNNCTFNVSGDVYNIWTWGAPTATFNNCTFNSDGKALLLYGTENTKLTVNDCTFNDNGGLTDLKAAIEIGNDYGKSYELIVNNTTVNGYEINDKGINTHTTLWGNKNSMGTDKLNVVVDGVDVY